MAAVFKLILQLHAIFLRLSGPWYECNLGFALIFVPPVTSNIALNEVTMVFYKPIDNHDHCFSCNYN